MPVSVLAGATLAVLLVPVAMGVSNHLLRTRIATAFDGRDWLARGNHEAWIYRQRDACIVH